MYNACKEKRTFRRQTCFYAYSGEKRNKETKAVKTIKFSKCEQKMETSVKKTVNKQ